MQSDPVNLFSCDVSTEQLTVVTLFHFHDSDKTQRQVQRHVSQETHVRGGEKGGNGHTVSSGQTSAQS